MADRVKIIKGFQDVLPPASNGWARIEATCRELFAAYGFEEARLPVLEPTELFARGIGEGTDIVEKEMYTFPDRKGRSLTLRPEGTAGVVRAYLASGLGKGESARWFYTGPMFRYERPQKGRYRQFYQIGAEAIGYPGPGTDAEIIELLDRLFKRLGIRERVSLEINSLGCTNCRREFRGALVGYLEGKKEALCEDCRRRLGINPLRVLDCKVASCKAAVAEAPKMFEFLDPDCRAHLEGLEQDLMQYQVEYKINDRIVRGLDYYTRTVFEFLADDGLGSQNAVCAGGRYDGLVEQFGGPPTPAIGFAFGMERIAMMMESAQAEVPEYFIVTLGDWTIVRNDGIKILQELRGRGLSAQMVLDGEGRSLKSLMKVAGKARAKNTIIMGENEVEAEEVVVKNMETGEQSRMKKKLFLAKLDGKKE